MKKPSQPDLIYRIGEKDQKKSLLDEIDVLEEKKADLRKIKRKLAKKLRAINIFEKDEIQAEFDVVKKQINTYNWMQIKFKKAIKEGKNGKHKTHSRSKKRS